MRILLLPLLLTACATTGQPGGGTSIRDIRPPAELPPEDFAGAQYADSRGCVYIRAGAAGNVTWVPRVDRRRQHLCNVEPTFS
ncbi:hypothetical protein AADZ90_017290 [Aestuariibius sp. 2305UL40-4]|uniref:hypothetical protein n=1 Tax=Aestuariibius violaceus TaxID=3234132 RepID=UPI00345EB437